MPCLDENAVAAFVSGQLDEHEAAELDAHVDGCADCLALLAAMAKSASLAPIDSDGASVEDEALARGARIGRYEIESLVGVGSMGAVYAANDPDLRRTVALKLVRARRGGEPKERHERLLREARTMAKLTHPNVVAVHDVGTFGERVFVAMDLVEGETLRTWLDAARTPDEILTAFVAAGRGLAAAHEANVVHRDFKPDNVLVGRDGRVVVTDFGLARGPATSDEEQRGMMAGTPAYMAPEQLRGEEVDARADQFAFCVALHEALGGERPFRGRQPNELLAAIDAQRFDDARLAPAHVRRALRRGLARSADARWPSMDALLVELSRDPAAKTRRLALAALAIALLGIAAAGTFSALQRQRASCRDGVPAKLHAVWNPTQRTAIHEAFVGTKVPWAEDAFARVASGLDADATAWASMHVEACDATHARAEQSAELLDLRVACLGEHLAEMHSLIDVLAHADADVVKNGPAAVHALTPLGRCADALSLEAIPAPPADRAAAIAALQGDLTRAKSLRAIGRHKESRALAEAAAEKSAAIGYAPLTAIAHLRLGEAEVGLGEAEAASNELRRAANLADVVKDDRTRAQALTLRLFAEGYLLRHGDRVTELDEEASAAVERAGGAPELAGNRQQSLGMALLVKGSLNEANTAFEDAVSLRERAHGPKSREVAMSRNGLCLVAEKRGDLEKALAACQRALDTWTDLLGPSHPDVALGMNNVGALLEELGRHDEACARFEASLRITEAALGTEHPQYTMALGNLGECLSARGEHERAIATQLRTLAIREKTLAPKDPHIVATLTNLGRAFLAAKDPMRAREAFERAEAQETSATIASEHADIVLGLASSLWETGDDGTRQRARKLVTDARPALPEPKQHAADAWLAAHPPP